MVAKPIGLCEVAQRGLNLAKIHMVAKLSPLSFRRLSGLNLAKIHMVAKRPTIHSLLSFES